MGLNLAEGAAYLGLKSKGILSDIERGNVYPSPESVARIQGATRGTITAADHMVAWRRAHPTKFAEFLAAGRSAAKAFPKTGRSKTEAKK